SRRASLRQLRPRGARGCGGRTQPVGFPLDRSAAANSRRHGFAGKSHRDVLSQQSVARRAPAFSAPEPSCTLPEHTPSPGRIGTLDSIAPVGIIANMKAEPVINERYAFDDRSFAEIVIWRLRRVLPGSTHLFKYRLAFVVNGVCVLRYDNE